MVFTKKVLSKKVKPVKDLNRGAVFSPKSESEKMYMLTDFDGRDYFAWARWFEGDEVSAFNRLRGDIDKNHCNNFYVQRDGEYNKNCYIVAFNLENGIAELLHCDVGVIEYDCELIYQEKH